MARFPAEACSFSLPHHEGAAGLRRRSHSRADVEGVAGHVVLEEVEAAELVLSLAARRSGDAVRELALRQHGALAVADAEKVLLVHSAADAARRTGALAVAGDVEAVAQDRVPDLALLVEEAAGVARAAGPGAGADRILAVGEEVALAVAQAAVKLLRDGAVLGALEDSKLRLVARGARGDDRGRLARGLGAGLGRGLGGALLRGVNRGRRGRVVVTHAAADREGGAGLVVAGVDAAPAVGLAAGRRGHAVREGAIGQDGALLVALAKMKLLVDEAAARLVGAATGAVDVVATADRLQADLEVLVRRHEARRLRAAGPRAAADRILSLGQQAALVVAEALEELLVARAGVAVERHSWRKLLPRGTRGVDGRLRRIGHCSQGLGRDPIESLPVEGVELHGALQRVLRLVRTPPRGERGTAPQEGHSQQAGQR
mmetsp:Transcript_21063/g.62853  ORF Transcript_21063/g.62853 Transcript_21063/m.62853 type:complete len:431 (+) Transcript_21063:119-1411(+)